MRIVYLNPNGTLGGAERALLDLVRAVRRAEPAWKLHLIAGSRGDLANSALELGVGVYILPLPAIARTLGDAGAGGPAGDNVSRFSMLRRLSFSIPQLSAYLLKLRRWLSAHRPNVLHSNSLKTHVLAAWAAPRGSRLLWHIHDYVACRPLMSRLIRAQATHCDMALANSHSVARDLDSVCPGKMKIHTVHNAIDLERFNPCGPVLDLDEHAGLAEPTHECLRVGLVATMARWKGHEVFLRALSMLPAYPPIRGYIVGGPIYETAGSQYSLRELHSVASHLGLNGRAGFTGFVHDSAAAIRALDIVVHASTQPEPFGLAVAEAMACGKPLIASRAGGITEIIIENETALAHNPGNAEELASCISRLASDGALRKRLGQNGRRSAEQHFDPVRLTREVVPIYHSIAN